MDETRDHKRRVKELERQLAETTAALGEASKNLARYQKAVETSRDGIVLYDSDARLVFCNQRYKELFEESAHALVAGATLDEVARVIAESGKVTDAAQDAAGWAARRIFLHRDSVDDPFIMRLSDGTWLRATNYRTSDGGMLGIRTDITELKRREMELQAETSKSEKRLEAFFVNSPVAMYIKNSDRRYRAVNAAFESQYGISAERAIGHRPEDVLDWLAAEFPEDHDRVLLDTGKLQTIQHSTHRADGSVGTAVTTQFPIFDQAGDISGIAGVSVDFTHYMAIQQQLADKSLLLGSTFRSIEQGLAVIDRDMRIIDCNQRFLKLHGYKGDIPDEGLPLYDIVLGYAKSGALGEGDPEKIAADRIAFLAGPDRPVHEEQRHPNGQIIDIRRTAMPDGLTVSTYMDITEIKRAEDRAEKFQQLMREILDTLPASVALYDAERRLVFANEATKHLFDWQKELHEPGTLYDDQVRDSLRKGMVLDTVGDEDDWLQNRLSNYRETRQNIETARPGGRWFLSSFNKTSDGGTVVIRFDISDRKRTEKALRDSEENFRNLFESSLLGISISRDEKLLFVNQAMADIFGYDSVEDMLQLGSTQLLVAPHERDRIRQYYKDRTEGRDTPAIYEFEGIRNDGERIWLQRSARIVSWRGLPAIQSTLIDVTERRLAEERMRSALTVAESANRSKSDFLARMSHELRTPLNAIIGFSEVLQVGAFGPLGHPKYQDYANDILASGKHLLEMITDVLDMSKIEAGKYDLSVSETDLHSLIDETVQVVNAQIERDQLTLETAIGAGVTTMLADRRAIKQVLLNLLSNAIKFTPAGGAIDLRVDTSGEDEIIFSVIDTGIGIDATDIEKVQQPFNQVGSAQVTVHPGTGLGLPIVKSLVELHGGQLQIESEPGVGTTVRVTIPWRHGTTLSTATGYTGSEVINQ